MPKCLLLSLLLASAAFAAPRFDPFEATIPEIRAALQSRRISCVQLVQWYLDRIEALDRGGPKLNSVRTVNPRALELARQLDNLPRSAPRGPLFCIPVILKDNINTADMPTTAGSVALKNSYPGADAFLTKRIKDAGAIVIAKANLTEFANFLTNGMPAGYSSLAGYVLNPYDPRPLPDGDGRQALSPGGSSAGSGAAAAANLGAVTVGTETSGSILSPSQQNALVGIKPTVGLISREGVIPIAASQDTAGPMTRTVTDAAILVGVMTGVDAKDPATADSAGKTLTDYTPYLRAEGLKGVRIGVPRNPYWVKLSTEVRLMMERALRVLREQGAELVDAEIVTAEELNKASSSVLRYEFRRDLNAYLATLPPNAPIKTLADVIAFNDAHKDVALKYGQTNATGSQALTDEKDREKYLADRARDIRLSRTEGIDATMERHNVSALFFPSLAGSGIAAKAGYPSIILPAGFLTTGAPYSVMFAARAFEEPKLIEIAYAFEQATKFRRPPGSALKLLPLSKHIQPKTVVNYASGVSGPVAAGEVVAIRGVGIGPKKQARLRLTPEALLDTSVAGTRVTFDGIPAPIVSASEREIVAVVPYAVAGKKNVNLHVEHGGRRSRPVPLDVKDASPGIYTDEFRGKGSPVILNADGARNHSRNPAAPGSEISFFLTGEGRPKGLGIDGRPASGALPVPAVDVSVPGLSVVGATALRGTTGTLKITARVPAQPASGELPLKVQIGGRESQTVPVFVGAGRPDR